MAFQVTTQYTWGRLLRCKQLFERTTIWAPVVVDNSQQRWQCPLCKRDGGCASAAGLRLWPTIMSTHAVARLHGRKVRCVSETAERGIDISQRLVERMTGGVPVVMSHYRVVGHNAGFQTKNLGSVTAADDNEGVSIMCGNCHKTRRCDRPHAHHPDMGRVCARVMTSALACLCSYHPCLYTYMIRWFNCL